MDEVYVMRFILLIVIAFLILSLVGCQKEQSNYIQEIKDKTCDELGGKSAHALEEGCPEGTLPVSTYDICDSCYCCLDE